MLVWKKGIYRLGDSSPSYRMSIRKAMAAASCNKNFWMAVSPRFWWRFTFS